MDLPTVQAGGGGIGGAIARAGLALLSAPYASGATVRGALYDWGVVRAKRVGVPVVSVGNLTAGGTGKTPFVAWLASRLVAAGRSPGILSRGHGPRPVGSALSDEGTLLADLLGGRVPQVEDPSRLRGAGRLLAEHPAVDVLLLDDGFQHRRIARDVDLVLIDATNPFGFGHFLPRGLLRERPRALRRAHGIVLTRTDRVPADVVAALRHRVASLAPRALVALARTRPRALVAPDGSERPLGGLAGVAVGAWSGIGNPAAFEATLADVGARVVWARRSRDHHRSTATEARAVVEAARTAGASVVVVTRKDLVKLRALSPRPDGVVALDVETDVVDGSDALLSLARGPATSPT